ncbi:glycosyltransferase [Parahaliea aestuarii]|uniref:Glycosyltransferase n=1 Tax=Parahaliea aestuarii TaxID=1852021 RepID=A0A5C8ZLR7_9GAMM|nr:glycosyltransferase [Parahaliea aestuarii]TXS89408.1 glycosyltransferase [Parahaliea aestuarii]
MGNRSDLVTVVIDCRGGVVELERSLASIGKQSLCECPHVVVLCDGSDISQAEASKSIAQFPWLLRIDLVQEGSGCSLAELLSLVRGCYTILLCSGDILHVNALEMLVDKAEQCGQSLVVGPVRYWADSRCWTHPSIDSYMASLGTTRAIDLLEYTLNQKAIITLYPTSLLLSGQVSGCRLEKLSEYLVDRYSAEVPNYGRAYNIPAKRATVAPDVSRGHLPLEGLESGKRNLGAWLIGERRGLGAEDNGIALFNYLTGHVPGVECYYVLDQKAGIEFPDNVSDRVLVKGSPAWKDALERSCVFCFTDSAADILLSNADVSDYLDRTFVFLTHGVLAYSPGVYPRDHPYIDQVIATSRADAIAANETWGFPFSRFAFTGLPRWDKLKIGQSDSRDILVCPTWRKSLNSDFWDGKCGPEEEHLQVFRESQFYDGWKSLLCNKELHSLLEQENLRIRVRLHFRFGVYMPVFEELASERIRIDPVESEVGIGQVMQSCIALITDYSSIMWDMAYMEKPTICYQFDKPAMLAERGRSAFSLPDEEMVAEVCYSIEGVTSVLERLVSTGFTLDEEQQAKLKRYVPQRDGKSCHRVYQEVSDKLCRICPSSVTPRRELSENELPLRSVDQALECWSGNGRVFLLGPKSGSGGETQALLCSELGNIENTTADDFILVEPYMQASSDWAEYFFNWEKTRELLERICNLKERNGVRIGIALPVAYCFRHLISKYLSAFDVVADAIDQYRQPQDSIHSCDVSVIVPVFNGERYLARCIESVLKQQFGGSFELLVVDDGSTDSTAKIVESFQAEHGGITLIRQSNSRQGVARNRGMLAARGKYITFLDADDVLPQHAIAELWCQTAETEQDLGIALVASTSGPFAPQRINQSYYHYTQGPYAVSAESWPHVFYDPSCVGKLYRKTFLIENGLFFPQSYHEDQLFCMQLFATGVSASVVKEILYFYMARQEEGVQSGTQTFTLEKLTQITRIGLAVATILKNTALLPDVVDHAIGFLLIRYDRYLWKRDQLGQGLDSILADKVALRALSAFLGAAPDHLILNSCKYNAVIFLLLKRQEFERCEQWLSGDRQDVAGYLVGRGAVSLEEMEQVLSGAKWQFQFNYYRAVEVGVRTSGAGWDITLVTDMSYGYRLGSIIVNWVKKPLSILMAPWHFSVLLFDMISPRGRKREQARRQALQATSLQGLEIHSDYVIKTAAYRLGVLLLEAAVFKGPKLSELPERIRTIYMETKN